MNDKNKVGTTRRKFLQIAGASSIVPFSETVSASGRQESEESPAMNGKIPDISIRNTRENQGPVMVKFVDTNSRNSNEKFAEKRLFSVPGRPSENSRVTDSIELEPGKYEVRVKSGNGQRKHTETKIWGVPPGGIPDHRSLVIRVRLDVSPLISSIEA